MRCHHWIALGAWLACAACGAGKGMEDEGSTDSGEDGGECQSGDFGTVMIELLRSPAEASDPFVGTASIITFLDYEECLSGFYTEDHPEYQQDGVEGAAIFEAWGDGCLCDMDNYDEAIPTCSVQSMSQNINTQGATDAARLVIDYALASDEIEGLHLPFGPLPTDTIAGCSGVVRLTGGSVSGRDAMGNTIWRIASFDNPVAKVGQGASIKIFVERTN